MNIVVTFSQYAAVLTKFNSIIGRKFGGEAGVFGGEPSPLPPPPPQTHTHFLHVSSPLHWLNQMLRMTR